MGAIELGLIIVALATKYGIPLAVDLVKTWKDNLGDKEPTKEDFEALRVADPESFFDK